MISQSLSILDFGYIRTPQLYAHQVINSLFNEVAVYESLGYKRLWLSEHYSPEFAWYSPEMLLPLLAGYSETIKIGIAGSLLAYHSPLLIAQNYKILSSIYPGRIDLGLARAFVPPHINQYLAPKAGDSAEDQLAGWNTKVSQLFSFLKEYDPETSLLKGMITPPQGTVLPETWFLGASGSAVDKAVHYESNFCLSLMHPGSSYPKYKDTIKIFNEQYFKTHGKVPQSSVLVAITDTEDSAQIEKFHAAYNETELPNPCGPADLIIEKLISLGKVMENTEFVLFYPEYERQKRLDLFHKIA